MYACEAAHAEAAPTEECFGFAFKLDRRKDKAARASRETSADRRENKKVVSPWKFIASMSNKNKV